MDLKLFLNETIEYCTQDNSVNVSLNMILMLIITKKLLYVGPVQECPEAVSNAWNWLEKAAKCLQTHLANAANYHKVRDLRGLLDYYGC